MGPTPLAMVLEARKVPKVSQEQEQELQRSMKADPK
jgi:hypothetical protein